MTLLRVTRGLPAAGKTTLAREWVAANPSDRVRVNRDDLRAMMYMSHIHGVTEFQVINARDFLILAMLRSGHDVICDDTNLPPRTMRGLRKLATKAGASIEVIDLTHMSLDECLRRNAARLDKPPVPEAVIRDMHAQYLAGTSQLDVV
jgi:predicted kinase